MFNPDSTPVSRGLALPTAADTPAGSSGRRPSAPKPFTMLRHDAQTALLDRLRTRCGSTTRAYIAWALVTELFRIADWKTGEVLGSDVALAVQLRINRKTWMTTAADLAATGVLERIGKAVNGEAGQVVGWRITPTAWLQLTGRQLAAPVQETDSRSVQHLSEDWTAPVRGMDSTCPRNGQHLSEEWTATPPLTSEDVHVDVCRSEDVVDPPTPTPQPAKAAIPKGGEVQPNQQNRSARPAEAAPGEPPADVPPGASDLVDEVLAALPAPFRRQVVDTGGAGRKKLRAAVAPHCELFCPGQLARAVGADSWGGVRDPVAVLVKTKLPAYVDDARRKVDDLDAARKRLAQQYEARDQREREDERRRAVAPSGIAHVRAVLAAVEARKRVVEPAGRRDEDLVAA